MREILAPGHIPLTVFLFLAALAAAAALFIPAAGATESQNAPPQVKGTIAIANGGQTGDQYLRPGDVIYFKVNLTKEVALITVTDEISQANHFHFRYDKFAAAGTQGHTPQKAVLTGVHLIGNPHLIYKHTIQQGFLSSGRSNHEGKLYFASSPAPAVTADLCQEPKGDSCVGFVFNAPADNSELDGAVQVAAGGPPNYTIGDGTFGTDLSQAHIANPNGSIYYEPGDKITIRTVYNLRIHPLSSAEMEGQGLGLRIGPNSATGTGNRTAPMVATGNFAGQGYVDYRYTVAVGDNDADGIKVWSLTGTYSICPERLGTGCPETQKASTPRPPGNGKILNARLLPTKLDLTNVPENRHFNLHAGLDVDIALATVTGTDPQYSDHIVLSKAMPEGLSIIPDTYNRMRLKGNPAYGQPSEEYKITYADVTGREASITIHIGVAGANPGVMELRNAPQDHAVIWYKHELATKEPFGLPAVTGRHTAPVTYRLTQADGNATLPGWLIYTQTSSTTPGQLAIATTTTEEVRVSLKLTATDSSTPTPQQAVWNFTVETEETPPIEFSRLTDGRYDFVAYVDNPAERSLPLQTIRTHPTNAVTYRLLAETGTGFSADALPSWITYATSTGNPAGTVSVKAGTGEGSVRLRLEATSVFYGDVATLDYTVSVAARADLDVDHDGLIEVSTPEQFMLMELDPDGDGLVSGADAARYYGSAGFPDIRNNPTGCPGNACAGYELTRDIDLTGKELGDGLSSYADHWQTVFDGKGFKITGLSIASTSTGETGLFEYIGSSGTVRNLGVKGAQVRGNATIGVIAGVNLGTINNVYVEDGIAAAAYNIAGLIAGQNGRLYRGAIQAGSISNFWATGAVSAANHGPGSAVGMNYGTVSNGWTDGFTEGRIPLGNANLGYSIIAGYSNGGTVNNVREIHGNAATAGSTAYKKVVTEEALARTNASDANFAKFWPAAVWEYGDDCQKPVLKSGGHTAAKQSAVQGSACPPPAAAE